MSIFSAEVTADIKRIQSEITTAYANFWQNPNMQYPFIKDSEYGLHTLLSFPQIVITEIGKFYCGDKYTVEVVQQIHDELLINIQPKE